MKTTEVSKDLIGRRCECIFTGMMVTGVIEDIEENEYSVNVKVHFDKPQQWGDDLYTEDWAWGRKTPPLLSSMSIPAVKKVTKKPDLEISSRIYTYECIILRLNIF